MIILLGFAASILVFLVCFWFFSNTNQLPAKSAPEANLVSKASSSEESSPFTISSKDIDAIAGDDVITTQLNLARAYMETGRTNLAKSILKSAILRGSEEQQIEANQLIQNLANMTQ